MNKYNVHIYREMKLYFPGIEADSPEEAATRASEMNTSDAEEIDDADGVNLSALVDIPGDEEYENSQFVDFEVQRRLNAFDFMHESLLLAAAYIQYVKQRIPEMHAEADGTSSIEQAIDAAIAEAEGTAA